MAPWRGPMAMALVLVGTLAHAEVPLSTLAGDAAAQRALEPALTEPFQLVEASMHHESARAQSQRAHRLADAGIAVVVASVVRGKLQVRVVLPHRIQPMLDRRFALRRGQLAAGQGEELRKALLAILPATPVAVPAPAVSVPVPATSALASAVTPPTPVASAPPLGVKPPEPARSERLPLIELAIGGGMQGRWLRYRDALTPALRDFTLPATPALSGSLAVYPLARTRVPVLAGIGVVGSMRLALGARARGADGETRSSAWTRTDVGLHLRVPVRRGSTPVTVGFGVGYGFERFRFAGAGTALDAELPGLAVGFVRLAADTSVGLGRVVLRGQVAGLPVLVEQGIGARLRDPHAGGVEATVGAGVPIGRFLEPRLTVGYTRYFHSFGPVPGDTYVAGGALDQNARVLVEMGASL